MDIIAPSNLSQKEKMAAAILFQQMRGIGPPYAAWKAAVLPLNYICTTLLFESAFLL